MARASRSNRLPGFQTAPSQNSPSPAPEPAPSLLRNSRARAPFRPLLVPDTPPQASSGSSRGEPGFSRSPSIGECPAQTFRDRLPLLRVQSRGLSPRRRKRSEHSSSSAAKRATENHG